MVEEVGVKKRVTHQSTVKPVRLGDVRSEDQERLSTGVREFDRVMGGGIVPGSVTLVAGDPGIGKSTLLTEIAALLSDRKVLYVCGEESPAQVRLRANRLDVQADSVHLLPETNVEGAIQTAADLDPAIMIVDSIQTLHLPSLSSAPGSVGQVRECTARLIRQAKDTGMAVFLVGHVTKEGTIAGPRVLEHMVDTVLQLEGDRHHAFRILRAAKNRFGSTNEIGVFEMHGNGLRPVDNPSRIFLPENGKPASGTAVVSTLEGTRPVLAELQALVTPTSYSTPQRSATGFEARRLQMLLAVLEKREGMKLSTHDVFVNVTGGLRLVEPSVDLGITMAVASSLFDRALPQRTLFVGEVGLGGEVRGVSQLAKRLKEAEKLGFKAAVIPSANAGEAQSKVLELIQVSRLNDAVDRVL
jgi:DNA repair protein RadA/Sms